ncbi:sulfurtransferase [Clostridium sp. FP2]|uniref:sulfurtransferase n=1 Tax=Clostridium TaxID=1485 RepID=UPI0013E95368|nr:MULTISPECIES: sulfurtransferase [Clostridium]MBW9157203.1 sulfurtransferase [Clostridium tagluense]MBZ9623016.1 sulfurtransferase [Clostridium sp. FP2]WLC67195.1 sulfurtransferase [Clostridium tagluense]
MNKRSKKFLSLLVSTILVGSLLVGCTTNKTAEKKTTTAVTQTEKTKATYADGSYITDAKWLSQNLKNKDILILDARSDKDYAKGHIPGAINVAWQGFSNMEGKPGDKGWGVVLSDDKLSEKLSAIGVDKTKTIVIYADNKSGWGEDGRFVWMLKMAGIENAKMLNGGFNFWESSKYEVSKEVTAPVASKFKVENSNKAGTINTEELAAKLGKVKILDSREKDEYNGAVKFGEARGGHIPGAINLTFNSLFKEDKTFKSAGEIEAIFKAAGLNKEDEIVTYCTAGIRSAHLALALRMMGYNNVKNYDESFYTWAKDASLKVEK